MTQTSSFADLVISRHYVKPVNFFVSTSTLSRADKAVTDVKVLHQLWWQGVATFISILINTTAMQLEPFCYVLCSTTGTSTATNQESLTWRRRSK